jgi:putative flippase GtrA
MEALVLSETRTQALKYVFVGLSNTAVTAAVIFSLLKIGIGIYPANASGYIVGVFFSFVMNAKFTFSASLSSLRFIKFISTCAICYILNLVAMKLSFMVMPDKIYTAQILGMFFYTATGFILNKYWSMK